MDKNDKFINEVFDRHKLADEQFSFRALREMVEQVMDEATEKPPVEVNKLLKLLRKNGYKAAQFIKFVSDRAQITNLGSKGLRQAIPKLLDANGIKWEYTKDDPGSQYKQIKIGNQVYDLIQGNYEGSAKEAPSCEVMNSTAFEGNLIYGLLYLGKSKKAAKTYLAIASKENKGIVCTPAALKNGIAAAKSILADVKKAGLDPAKSARSSGGAVTASLTDSYRMHGVASNEAKADIIIGGVGTSIKQKEASQFMSAQGPELAAIVDVAMNSIAKKQKAKLSKEIDDFTASLQRAVGSDSKAHATPEDTPIKKVKSIDPETGEEIETIEPNLKKGTASWYRSKKSLAKSSGTGDTTLFGKLVTKAINIDDMDELSPEEKEQLESALKGTAAESFMELREGVKDILGDPMFKAAVCKEGITGYGKFNEEPPKAQAMLKWSSKQPSDAEFVMLYRKGRWNNKWFERVAQAAKLEIRERGNAAQRGGAGRAEMDKYSVDKKGRRIRNEGWLDEDFSEEELKEIEAHSAELYSYFISEQVLQEGAIWDAVKGAASKAKDVASKIWKKISDFIARATKYIKGLFQKGFSFLVEALGFEIASLEFNY